MHRIYRAEMHKDLTETGIARPAVVVGSRQKVGDKGGGGLVRGKGGNEIAQVALLKPRDSPLMVYGLQMLHEEVMY